MKTYPSHVLEDFIAAPTIETPIIIVLLGTPNTKRPITSAGTTKELPSTQCNSSAINPVRGFALQVPICFGIEVLAPSVQAKVGKQNMGERGGDLEDLPARHVHILKLFVVLSGFDEKDRCIGVFGKSACDNATACAPSASVSKAA